MRKTYSPEFKAKLVMEVFRGERLLNEIASENNVHLEWYHLSRVVKLTKSMII